MVPAMGVYPCGARFLIKCSYASIAAFFSPYMPFSIRTYTYPSSVTLSPKLYLALMSSGKCFHFIFMYSARRIGDAKKKFTMSAVMKRAPLFASEMVLLSRTLSSRRFEAGDPVSSGHSRRSPPTVIRILCVSVLRGLWLQTNVP